VTELNDAPTAATASIQATEDGGPSAPVDPQVVDVDSDSHSYAIESQGAKGIAEVIGDQLVYTPNADADGEDSFTFRATDNGSESVVGTATVTIASVNDAPTATSAAIRTAEDAASVPLTPDVSDVDIASASGDSFTFEILSQPANGSAQVVGNQLVYMPNADYVGSDSFTYRVTDSGGESIDGTATVTVGGDNDAPSAASASIATSEDAASAPVTPQVSDVDDEAHSFSIVSQPANGSAAVVGNQLVYTPDANFNGDDSFTFRAIDDENGSVIGTATVVVAPVNDAPTATSAAIATSEDADSALVAPSVSDVDSGDSHSFTVLTQPSLGTAAVVDNQLLYSPNPDANGSDSFTFRATDSAGQSVDGTATVTVNAVNDAPSATSADIVTDEDTASAGVTPAVTDVDDSEHTLSIVTQPANGSAAVVDGQLVYTPAADFIGSDSFVYMATDAAGAGVNGTATVTVSAVNDEPVLLHGDINGLYTYVGGSLSVAFAVSDSDTEDSHSYSVSGAQTRSSTLGTASFEGATLTFEGQTAGSETLTVTVSDGTASDSYSFPVTVVEAPAEDANGDGISDAQAAALGLDPEAGRGDSDGDGTPDAVELGTLDNPVDSDGDGVIDAVEENGAAHDSGRIALRISDAAASAAGVSGLGGGSSGEAGENALVIEAAEGHTLSIPADLSGTPLIAPSSLTVDLTHSFPLGLYGFSVDTGGDSVATVTVRFPVGTEIPEDVVVRKLTTSDTWEDFPSATLDREARTLTLTLVDNDRFDHDRSVGVIRDPVGLGVPGLPSVVSDNSDEEIGVAAGGPLGLLGLALLGGWRRWRRRRD